MKRLNILIGALSLALSGAALSSCNEDFEQPPVDVPEYIGDGTWERPLQVWQAHLGTTIDGHLSNWVTGYIVGCINSDITNSFTAAEIADGTTPGAKNNNVLIAQYPYDEDEWEKLGYTIDDCVAVQLKYGACRSAVNLLNHPENFNRLVSLRGTTGSKYMGEYGLRDCYEFNWGDKGRYEEAMEAPAPGQYYCNFSVSRDINYYRERGWSLFMEKGGLDGWSISEYDERHYLTCSSYYGTANGGPYKSWVVSPKLDLDKVEQKTLSFNSQSQDYAAGTELKVYLMRHQNPTYYGEEIGIDAPVQLQCVTSTNNGWTASGTIDLSDYEGEVYIGFLYEAEKGGDGATTYNVTDFNFGGCNPADWEVTDPTTIGKYVYADEVKSGHKYVLVFNEQLLAKRLSETSNYGRLTLMDVDIDEGTFEAKKDLAITFIESTSEDGESLGWQLVDSFNRTMYMDPAYATSFELMGNAGMPASGGLWSITKQGNQFKITNLSVGATIYYSVSNNNCAPGTSGVLPDLYELVEE